MAPRDKELSKDLKDLIIKYFKENKTVRGIAENVNKSLALIQKVIEKYKTLSTTENKPRSGRPRTFTTVECRVIVRKVQKNP